MNFTSDVFQEGPQDQTPSANVPTAFPEKVTANITTNPGNPENPRNGSQQRPMQGGFATTIQLNLHQVRPASNSAPSLKEHAQIHDSESNSLHSSFLRPADEGFGAWSYVASAFAMFIVVWGMYHAAAFQLGST